MDPDFDIRYMYHNSNSSYFDIYSVVFLLSFLLGRGGGVGRGFFLSFFSSFRVNIISILISKTIKKTIEPCFSTCNLVTKHMSEEFSIRARSDEQGFLSNSLQMLHVIHLL